MRASGTRRCAVTSGNKILGIGWRRVQFSKFKFGPHTRHLFAHPQPPSHFIISFSKSSYSRRVTRPSVCPSPRGEPNRHPSPRCTPIATLVATAFPPCRARRRCRPKFVADCPHQPRRQRCEMCNDPVHSLVILVFSPPTTSPISKHSVCQISTIQSSPRSSRPPSDSPPRRMSFATFCPLMAAIVPRHPRPFRPRPSRTPCPHPQIRPPAFQCAVPLRVV